MGGVFSKKSWPFERFNRVIVFVDFMNVWMSQTHTFQGDLRPKRILEECAAAGRLIGDDVHVLCFLDVMTFEMNAQLDALELKRTAQALGVRVMDVPPVYSSTERDMQDDVDATMFRAMTAADRKFSTEDTAFVLVTADADFLPTVNEIVGRGRKLLLSVTTNTPIPSIARAGTAWRWLFRSAYAEAGLRFAFGITEADAGLVPYYDHYTEYWPDFRRSFKTACAAASLLRPAEWIPGADLESVVVLIASRSAEQTRTNDLRFLVEAMAFYGFLEEEQKDGVTKGYRVTRHVSVFLRARRFLKGRHPFLRDVPSALSA